MLSCLLLTDTAAVSECSETTGDTRKENVLLHVKAITPFNEIQVLSCIFTPDTASFALIAIESGDVTLEKA